MSEHQRINQPAAHASAQRTSYARRRSETLSGSVSHAIRRALGMPASTSTLRLGSPGDEYERAAIASMHSNTRVGRITAGHANCGASGSKRGRSLSPVELAYLQPRFGGDLSAIRIHDSGIASRSAQALGAAAYTLGTHIAFAPGKYSPTTQYGRQLLAHEVTHTTQRANDSVIRCWAPWHHYWITEDALMQLFHVSSANSALSAIAGASFLMDFYPRELEFNILGLTRKSDLDKLRKHYAAHPVNASHHGEGGLYARSDLESSEACLREENRRIKKLILVLIAQYTEGDTKTQWPIDLIIQLGEILHIAQDRGAHHEGAAGEGHSNQEIDPDNPSQNGVGYAAAQKNTRAVLRVVAPYLRPWLHDAERALSRRDERRYERPDRRAR